MDLIHLSSILGTGRFEFKLEYFPTGNVYARLERKVGSDAHIERLTFFKFYDGFYVDCVHEGLTHLTKSYFQWEISRLQLCSDEALCAISSDSDYPLIDLKELRWFCDTYKAEISCLRMYSFPSECDLRFPGGFRPLRK